MPTKMPYQKPLISMISVNIKFLFLRDKFSFSAVQDVQFDLLIRIEIVWSPVAPDTKQLCLTGLEVRKIGLLQPIQILDEIDGKKYRFGCKTQAKIF